MKNQAVALIKYAQVAIFYIAIFAMLTWPLARKPQP
jgi:hypothetical protein